MPAACCIVCAAQMIVASKTLQSSSIMGLFARVVKLVYTAGLKPAAANHGMPVRSRSLAPRAINIAKTRVRGFEPGRSPLSFGLLYRYSL